MSSSSSSSSSREPSNAISIDVDRNTAVNFSHEAISAMRRVFDDLYKLQQKEGFGDDVEVTLGLMTSCLEQVHSNVRFVHDSTRGLLPILGKRKELAPSSVAPTISSVPAVVVASTPPSAPMSSSSSKLSSESTLSTKKKKENAPEPTVGRIKKTKIKLVHALCNRSSTYLNVDCLKVPNDILFWDAGTYWELRGLSLWQCIGSFSSGDYCQFDSFTYQGARYAIPKRHVRNGFTIVGKVDPMQTATKYIDSQGKLSVHSTRLAVYLMLCLDCPIACVCTDADEYNAK